jgi:signal transduction histidine kinase
MSSIGQLAAGVAHEINNPVGFINSNLTTLNEYLADMKRLFGMYAPLDRVMKDQRYEEAGQIHQDIEKFKQEIGIEFIVEDLTKILDESKEGVERVTSIVKSLKDFSHVDTGDKRVEFDLNEGLESTLRIVWNELKYKAEVIREYGEIPKVSGLPQQINQVFMNLLVNAAQAIHDKGKIKIRTYKGNGWVNVEISDTGTGMSDEVKRRVFEPFFTTKPVGKGTGLGLSIVYGIMEKHHGKIEVESEVGKGTKFTVRLPLEMTPLLEI